MATKICRKCGIEKDVSAYSKGEITKFNKDGLLLRCKQCEKNRRKQWRKNNPDKIKLKNKRWRENNPEYYPEYNHSYYKSHQVKIINRRKERRKTDEQLIATEACRNAVRRVFEGKAKYGKTIKWVGLSYKEFKKYIENKFQPGMTWLNRGIGKGKWVIDHINPCASFDLSNPEHKKWCCLFINLRPLWWEENAAKGDRSMTEIFTNANKNNN